MTGSMPWSTTPRSAPTNDPNELLQRIDRNTSSLLSWVKILIAVVVIMGLLTVILG